MKNSAVFYFLFFSTLIGLKTEPIRGQNAIIYDIHSNKGEAILVINTYVADSTLSKSQLDKIDRLIIAHHPDSLLYQYQQLYVNKGFYEDNDHIKNHLPKKLLEDLEKRFSELGLPLGHYPRMKPWLMTKSLFNLELKNLGLEEDKASPYFIQKATELNWKISTINNEDQKLKILYNLSERDQIRALKKTIKTSKKRLLEIKKLSWKWDKNHNQKVSIPKILKKQDKQSLSLWIAAIKATIASKETPLILMDFQDTETINKLTEQLKKEGFEIQLP